MSDLYFCPLCKNLPMFETEEGDFYCPTCTSTISKNFAGYLRKGKVNEKPIDSFNLSCDDGCDDEHCSCLGIGAIYPANPED